MPTAITPVPRFTNSTPTRPAPGESAGWETGPSPLLPIFQALFDRAQYVRGITWGLLIGADEFSVDGGGSSTSFVARLNAFEAMSIQDIKSVFWPVYNTAETTFTQADYAGGTLPNDSWIYAYLGIATDGTTLVKELSTTAPNASKTWKSDNLNRRRFVGCFRTSSTGAPFPIVTVKGRTLYRRSDIANVDNTFATDGLMAVHRQSNQATPTDLGLSARIPPHARTAILVLHAIGDNTGPAPAALNVYSGSDTTSIADTAYTVDHRPVRQRTEVVLGSGTTVKYTFITAGATVDGYVYVMGWE